MRRNILFIGSKENDKLYIFSSSNIPSGVTITRYILRYTEIRSRNPFESILRFSHSLPTKYNYQEPLSPDSSRSHHKCSLYLRSFAKSKQIPIDKI